jgi:6-pyruvoyl-tetrahydropterin synthase
VPEHAASTLKTVSDYLFHLRLKQLRATLPRLTACLKRGLAIFLFSDPPFNSLLFYSFKEQALITPFLVFLTVIRAPKKDERKIMEILKQIELVELEKGKLKNLHRRILQLMEHAKTLRLTDELLKELEKLKQEIQKLIEQIDKYLANHSYQGLIQLLPEVKERRKLIEQRLAELLLRVRKSSRSEEETEKEGEGIAIIEPIGAEEPEQDTGRSLQSIAPPSGYVSPPPGRLITVRVYTVDVNGSRVGPAAGAKVRVGNAVYAANREGVVEARAGFGEFEVEVLETRLSEWRRYTFWRWCDGSTDNPRKCTAEESELAACVYDERLVKVAWEPDNAGHVKVNGARVSNGWAAWFRYRAQLKLEAVEGSGWRLEKWQRRVDGGTLSDWTAQNPVETTLKDGYEFKAIFAPARARRN